MKLFEQTPIDQYRPKKIKWNTPLNVKALLYIAALAVMITIVIWSRL